MEGLVQDVGDGVLWRLAQRVEETLGRFAVGGWWAGTAQDESGAYQGEVLPTPLCRVLSCVPVEYREEALAVDAGEGDDDGVGVFHETPWTFRLGHCALEGEVVGEGILVVCAGHDLSGDELVSASAGKWGRGGLTGIWAGRSGLAGCGAG